MDLYGRARKMWSKTQFEQVHKGVKKYGVSLEKANLSGAELVKHAVQENVDQMHYIMALGDVVERQQNTIEVQEKELMLLKAERDALGIGPTFNRPAPMFKPGDKVQRKNGKTFSNDKRVVTVIPRPYGKQLMPNAVWLDTNHGGGGTWLHFSELEHVPVMPATPSKGINQLRDEAYKNALDKGWHDEHRSFGDYIALIHSELSEALEDFRAGNGVNRTWHEFEDGSRYEVAGKSCSKRRAQDGTLEVGKPCGIPSELADVVIRVLDMCGAYGIDLEGMIAEKMAYNATRPQRHGGKTL